MSKQRKLVEQGISKEDIKLFASHAKKKKNKIVKKVKVSK